MPTITPFLMFNDRLAEAINFYASVFPDVRINGAAPTKPGLPAGTLSASFELQGQRFNAYQGGPHFQFTDAFSLFVECEDQAEVDHYWNALLADGGAEQQCGWLTDPFGVRWQIIPRQLMELMADPDPAKAAAVVDAMLKMVKIDVAGLEQAHRAA